MSGYFDVNDSVWSNALPLPLQVHKILSEDRSMSVHDAISLLLENSLVLYKSGPIMIALMHDPDAVDGSFSVFYGIVSGVLVLDCPAHGEEEYELTHQSGVFAEYSEASSLQHLPLNWEQFKVISYERLYELTETV